MPKPTKPAKRVCYADDITVWASGVQIPVLEQQINSYLEKMSTFLKDNSLLISAPKSTVTLFTPDPFQARTHPEIAIADAILLLKRTPKILGVLLDTSFAFHHHCEYVANRISKRNNILKALAGTAERNPANDLQGRWTIDRRLRSTCLEHQRQQHQHGKDPGCTKRSSQNFHWRTQDVKH